MSIGPSSSSSARRPRSTCDESETSPCTRERAVRRLAAEVERRDREPLPRASRSTVAAPMPLAPPVTSATRPENRSSFVRATAASLPRVRFDPGTDYPLGSRRPDLVRTPSGLPLDEVTLDGGPRRARSPRPTRAPRPRRSRLQAEVARAAGTAPARRRHRARRRARQACPTTSCSRSTRRCGPAARRPTSSSAGPRGSTSSARRAPPRSCARRPTPTRERGLLAGG